MSELEHEITPALFEQLTLVAERAGIARFGIVRLDHPGFAPARSAFQEFVAHGWAGEMHYLERTREARLDPRHMLHGARSLLVGVVPHAGEARSIARYAQTDDYHTIVHQRLLAVERSLHERLPGVRTIICVDTKPILERTAAALAGVGFLGKHGLLITPKLGSFVLLGEILTTAGWSGMAESTSNVPWEACGSCTACLDACPTQAFVAPGRLDPRACISYLTIEHRGHVPDHLADRMGERVAGCDACQEACPYNHGMRTSHAVSNAWLEAGTKRREVPELLQLARLSRGDQRRLVRRSPLGRIPRTTIRRNALLALGNRNAPLSSEERELAHTALRDGDPHIRAAAQRLLTRRAELDESGAG